jgi:hypothetical protein
MPMAIAINHQGFTIKRGPITSFMKMTENPSATNKMPVKPTTRARCGSFAVIGDGAISTGLSEARASGSVWLDISFRPSSTNLQFAIFGFHICLFSAFFQVVGRHRLKKRL